MSFASMIFASAAVSRYLEIKCDRVLRDFFFNFSRIETRLLFFIQKRTHLRKFDIGATLPDPGGRRVLRGRWGHCAMPPFGFLF